MKNNYFDKNIQVQFHLHSQVYSYNVLYYIQILFPKFQGTIEQYKILINLRFIILF